jgi:hypothetical protein
MSTYKNFAIAGVGNVGMFIAQELLKQKTAGKANEITILTHKVFWAGYFHKDLTQSILHPGINQRYSRPFVASGCESYHR